MITIKPRFVQFSAIHFLPQMPDGHRCRNLHGHTYKVTVEIGGQLRDGMLPDYAVITEIVRRYTDPLDHGPTALNDVPGLENPTTEIFAQWLADRIGPDVSAVGAVLVALELDEGGHVGRWQRD